MSVLYLASIYMLYFFVWLIGYEWEADREKGVDTYAAKKL